MSQGEGVANLGLRVSETYLSAKSDKFIVGAIVDEGTES